MLSWLKSLFQGPKPAGPPRLLRSFSTSDSTINNDSISEEADTFLIESKQPQSIPLFEIENPDIEKCILTFRAQLKTENFEGEAYLEMWCRFPGKGEFFSRGIQQALKGTNDWSTKETPFYLKRGQQPDLIKLNIAAQGVGSVWAKSIELLVTPLE